MRLSARPVDLVWSAVIVALTTIAARGLRTLLGLPDPEMLYLLAIMVTAVRFGRAPSILAAALSVGAYDFFFVPPAATFTVADSRYLLTFAMMFGVGLVIGTLVEETKRVTLKTRTEELRSALLSSVSHDLRTPLATITGAATALRDRPELPAAARDELVATVCDEAVRLERLVSNLLEMTRLESGATVPRREWVPLEELVGAALNRLEPSLAGRPLRVDLPADLPLVPVDPVLVEQVLINLVDNAAKHTPVGLAIELRARAISGAVEVTVDDRGPGLAPDERERVFERFYRGASGATGGAGLGLAICRAILAAHGGTIAAEARAGGGTRFRVVLPIVGAAPELPPSEEVSHG